MSSILDAFLGTPAMAGKGLTTAGITTTGLTDALNGFRTRTDNVNAPWAYINWIFLDEQFNYAGGGFDRIGGNGVVKDHNNVTIPTLTAPKNGYVFVYCSNESQYNVFFDNLQVIHTRGPLLEETHYYPFGLVMSGISSKAAGSVENKKKFNGIEHTTELDLNQYDAFYRTLDPQIGRFWQIDPKPSDGISLYAAMDNNPVLKADPLGDTTIVDKRGYIVKQYGKDNLVFLQKGKKLTQIGELGKSIDASKIFKNLLAKNIDYAKGVINPNTFRKLVKGNGEWDLKNNKKTIYGLANSFDKGKENQTQFSFEGKHYTAQDLGNYHYGATGKAVWAFSEETLLRAAGGAQIAAGTSKPEWQVYEERASGDRAGTHYSTLKPPFGDDPHDQNMIKAGFKYYNTNKNNLKEED